MLWKTCLNFDLSGVNIQLMQSMYCTPTFFPFDLHGCPLPPKAIYMHAFSRIHSVYKHTHFQLRRECENHNLQFSQTNNIQKVPHTWKVCIILDFVYLWIVEHVNTLDDGRDGIGRMHALVCNVLCILWKRFTRAPLYVCYYSAH